MDPFEWNPRKASANCRKHGVEFADATAGFEDEQALTVTDEITASTSSVPSPWVGTRLDACWWWPTPGARTGSASSLRARRLRRSGDSTGRGRDETSAQRDRLLRRSAGRGPPSTEGEDADHDSDRHRRSRLVSAGSEPGRWGQLPDPHERCASAARGSQAGEPGGDPAARPPRRARPPAGDETLRRPFRRGSLRVPTGRAGKPVSGGAGLTTGRTLSGGEGSFPLRSSPITGPRDDDSQAAMRPKPRHVRQRGPAQAHAK